jgi:guanylate kinase
VEEKLAEGKDVFLEIEVQGALQVMQKCPQAVSIFLTPPRFSDLEERLRKRGTETEAVLQERLKKAKEEMGFMDRFTYVVTNDDVDEAVDTIRTLILQERFNFDIDLARFSEGSAK